MSPANKSSGPAASTGSDQPQDTGPAGSAPSGYLVLARRYRPTQFEQVVGQQHVTRTLQNAIAANRVHHAYLLTGCRGVGKTTVARIMAKALNCDNGPTPTPCDQCDSCADIREGRAVDVFEIDGASHTGVDDVRELRESVRYAPTRNRHKIYIIDEVHMLSTSAFNALLKTLEEPPPHVVFIFATTEPHKIPATILSRCQRFDFKRVPGPMLVQHLQSLCDKEQVAVAPAGLSLIARAAEGSVRDALSLLDQVLAYHAGEEEISPTNVAEVLGVTDRRVLFALSAALLARDAQQGLELVDRLFESGQDLSQFAQAFLAHLRDLTVARTCADPGPLLDATEAEVEELSRQATDEQGALWPQHFDHFARVTEEIARSSFPRLLLEMAIIEMVNAEPLLPLGDLLQRLEEMEARLGPGSPAPGPAGPTTGGRGRTPGGGSSPRRQPPTRRRAQASAAQANTGQPAAAGDFSAAAPPAPASLPQPAARPPQSPARPPQSPAHSRGAAPARAEAAAAAPPPTGAPGPTGDGDMQRWQQLLEGAMALEPVAASAFAAGRLISWTDATVTLGYPPDSFELGWARDPKKLEAFEAACSQQAGRRIEVQINEVQADAPEVQQASAFQEQEQRRADRTRKLREEAEGHPVTRTLIESFGARINGITTEADER